MARKSATDFNRLKESSVAQLAPVPLLGILVLNTDDGLIDMAINKATAEELRTALDRFIAGRAQTVGDVKP
ncbi:hypothetical protein LJR030_003152 [Rhizobium sp. LjRoot30]|uniref:hypothetical protein n=1 Tax=Rhizobium sp. LjRoot30 TaxID=3342320 RepID=UPI003ED0BB81